MKLPLRRKQSISFIIIALGIALFASAAFADLISGSAYVDFKEAIKETARLTENSVWSNYTVSTVAGFSLDGQALLRQEIVTRESKTQRLGEVKTLYWSNGVEESYLRLEDGNESRLISKASNEDFWRVVENYPVSHSLLVTDSFTEGMALIQRDDIIDIFSDPRSQDIERIVDAVVGNLANLMQSEPTANGGRRYFGTVIHAQLPPLVQALGSLAGSRAVYSGFDTDFDKEGSLSSLREMIIDQVSGEALQSSEGWLSKVTLTVRFHGFDASGNSYQAQLDLGYEIYDIGNTVIQLPDLSTEQVEVEQYKNWHFDTAEESAPLLTAQYYGHYVSVLGEYTVQGWQKRMERHFEVSEIDGQLECHYWEIVHEDANISPIDVTFMLPNEQTRYGKGYGRGQEIEVLTSDAQGQEVTLGGYFDGSYTPGLLELVIWDSRDPVTNAIVESHAPWVRVFDR